MRHDPLVSIEDALRACRLILEFTEGMDEEAYREDIKTMAAVERCGRAPGIFPLLDPDDFLWHVLAFRPNVFASFHLSK